LLAAGLAAAGALSFGFWWVNRVPSTREVSALGLKSLLQPGDRRYVRFLDTKEVSQVGLTKDSFEKVMREYVWPEMQKFRKQGGLTIAYYKPDDSATASQNVLGSDAQSQPITVTARSRQEGPYLESFCSIAVMTAAAQKVSKGAAADPRLQVLQTVRSQQEQLERLGMKGLVTNGRFFSWTEFSEDIQRRVNLRPYRKP
jgi:hypothetical protein